MQLEESFRSALTSVLMARFADPLADARHDVYEAFVSLLEGLRIVDCIAAFGFPCVGEAEVKSAMESLCPQLRSDLEVLAKEGVAVPGVAEQMEGAHFCWNGRASLQTARDRALPMLTRMFDQVLLGCDKALLAEWQADKTPFPKLKPLFYPAVPWLLYPSAFVPPSTCGRASFGDDFDRFLPEDEEHRPWRDVSGLFVPYLAADAVLRRLDRKGVDLSRFSVNLGAANGACGWGSLYDPVNCLLADRSANASAILFEGASHNFGPLLEAYSYRKKVFLRLGYTTPSLAVRDVLAVMPATGVDLLKVDVDNCDSCFVDALVRAGTRPKVIHVELAAPLPPPLTARIHFRRPPGIPGRIRMCGSLSEFMRVSPGYRLLHVEYVNALLVRQDLFQLVAGPTRLTDEEKWRLGYFCHPLRTMSSWGEDMTFRKLGKDVSILADRAVPLRIRREFALALQAEEAEAQRYVILDG